MKRIIVSIISILWAFALASAQNVSFEFRYYSYYDEKNSSTADADMSMKVYDNCTITLTGNVQGIGSINYSLPFHTLSLFSTLYITFYESETMEKDKPYIVVSNHMATYYDPSRDFECSFWGNNSINDQAFNSCLDAIDKRTGPFSSFRGEAEIELPVRVDNNSSNAVEITHPADGGRVMHTVTTKSGKTLDQTSYKDFSIESSASWCQIMYKTEKAFHIVTDANTTGNARNATITITAGGRNTWVFVTQPSKTSVINKVWVEHNKFQGLSKGMKIHIDFETYNMKGKTGTCSAFFYFSDGRKLMDYNYQYRASDGQVCTWTNFTPNYDQSVFSDVVLFIPYSELHLGGSADCKFIVEVSIGGQATDSEYYSFRFN